jgi:hypothetical protein
VRISDWSGGEDFLDSIKPENPKMPKQLCTFLNSAVTMEKKCTNFAKGNKGRAMTGTMTGTKANAKAGTKANAGATTGTKAGTKTNAKADDPTLMLQEDSLRKKFTNQQRIEQQWGNPLKTDMRDFEEGHVKRVLAGGYEAGLKIKPMTDTYSPDRKPNRHSVLFDSDNPNPFC